MEKKNTAKTRGKTTSKKKKTNPTRNQGKKSSQDKQRIQELDIRVTKLESTDPSVDGLLKYVQELDGRCSRAIATCVVLAATSVFFSGFLLFFS
jgi:hypothetical protein